MSRWSSRGRSAADRLSVWEEGREVPGEGFYRICREYGFSRRAVDAALAPILRRGEPAVVEFLATSLGVVLRVSVARPDEVAQAIGGDA